MSLMTAENTFTTEIITLVRNTKQRMAVAVNAELTMLYWHIGSRINQHILQENGRDMGKKLSALWQRD